MKKHKSFNRYFLKTQTFFLSEPHSRIINNFKNDTKNLFNFKNSKELPHINFLK